LKRDIAQDPRELIESYLSYCPNTGDFRWKRANSNRVRIGAIAGTISDQGYRIICIERKDYRAHRLAWLLHYGQWPDGELDHVNCVRDDNRISNLRRATRSQNVHNTRIRRNNTSGVKGVSFQKLTGKWVASITVHNRTIKIGSYDSIADGRAAYEAAARMHFGEFFNDGANP
jgi:hypothetical protein